LHIQHYLFAVCGEGVNVDAEASSLFLVSLILPINCVAVNVTNCQFRSRTQIGPSMPDYLSRKRRPPGPPPGPPPPLSDSEDEQRLSDDDDDDDG